MGQLVGGAVLVVLGLVLFSREREEFGLFNLAFGAFFIWRGARRARRRAVSDRHSDIVLGHHAEIWSRAEKGETPDQIIQAFETQYKIPPVRTLEYMAGTALVNVGRAQDREKTQAFLSWFASNRIEPLPSPADLLEHMTPNQNLYATANGVRRHFEPDRPGESTLGSLIATRTHLFFLPFVEQESFGGEAAKETVIHALPPVVGIGSLAKTIAEGVEAELTKWSSPALIKELKHRLTLSGGIAVPWRELAGVRKDVVKGAGFERVQLVVLYGDRNAPDELRASSGKGFDEAWVDNWIDVARTAAILEGLLLFV